MLKRKRIRNKGKVSLKKYFQKFDSGDSVAIVKELGQQNFGYSDRFQGKTGKIVSKRGSAYLVQVSDYNMTKYLTIKPVHLKKITGEIK